jgi:hypothetical protein
MFVDVRLKQWCIASASVRGIVGVQGSAGRPSLDN